mmetsp:Transcript_16324/g.18158  ORF Transcript_16324/g.18158 Transcript_16324/m.18158 type:complete len:152 (-) Transcript_16324:57-512(-)|eukprot:CAMPEP_0168510758 /NCGR_PEP_ID=MMETSP0405-20121227/1668_1 /TAXON_ID=498012 /ORGANISM="Trichosphaerium sp, Strain Am-I-7 wt" /LENGTH=151 /DNA_ID=CAMNT_0008528681 /DNA_START=49 /DNA_END=504 /DNA_ORIENTATION=-
MSTRASASAVFPLPIDTVWAAVRDFTFPAKLISTVKSASMEENASPTSVGAVRKLEWETGNWRKQKLIGLSDLDYTISWELVGVDLKASSEVTAIISTIKLYRITETNQTLVSWSSDFAADVQPDFVRFETESYTKNLVEMRTSLVEASKK